MEFFGYYLIAFTLSVACVFALRRPAVDIGLVDYPGGRKRHAAPIPLVGGVAMFIAFALVAFLLWPFPLKPYGSLLAGMLLLVAVGVLDDRYEITRGGRFMVQVLAALIMTSWGEVQIVSLGNLVALGDMNLGQWAIPFTVICAVGLINAVNMTDGFDGLAGGIVMVALLWLGFLAAVSGINGFSVPMLVTLASCIAGFLIFNMRSPWRRKASVFMGDAGSLMLGFALAWFAIYISQAQTIDIPPMTIAWILALPIYDTVTVIFRRMLRGASPFRPARDHIHHILIRARVNGCETTYVLVVASAIYGGMGVTGWLLGLPEWVMFLSFIAMGCLHLWFSITGWRYLRLLRAARFRTRTA